MVQDGSMRALIVGGCGYFGSHLVRGLTKRNHDVVVIDNLVSGHVELLPKDVPFYEVDAGVLHSVAKVFQKH
jgi:UDP-glucose 4-epimerase